MEIEAFRAHCPPSSAEVERYFAVLHEMERYRESQPKGARARRRVRRVVRAMFNAYWEPILVRSK